MILLAIGWPVVIWVPNCGRNKLVYTGVPGNVKMRIPSETSLGRKTDRPGETARPDVRRRPPSRWAMWSCCLVILVVTILSMRGVASLAKSGNSRLKLDTGKEIYMAGCTSCHGPDGRGQSRNLAGFERPSTFPDFTDCPTSTPEPDVQWRAILTHGGPARGFSEIMPSFKDELTQEQIGKVIEYLRGLCTEKAWPRGNFNLPRPLVTEKAFPENEVVITGAFNLHKAPGGSATVIYEKRIGPSGMIEAAVPYNFAQDSGVLRSGFGDIALGYKRKLIDNLKKGSIFSLGGELVAPTGNPRIGTGGGSPVFETSAAYGQIFPPDSFLQLQTGVELPTQPDKVPRAYYLRGALGKTFSTRGGLGRRWSPMAEFIADRDLVTGATTNWDIVPEIQIPISKRMHILANVGVRIPVNNTADRPKQIIFYFLWDYVDGTLRQGW
jgi:mono/diheme cytochrome c family protein